MHKGWVAFLIILQGVLMSALFVANLSLSWRLGVLAVGWVASVILLATRQNEINSQKNMLASLRRAVQGNLNTRLLTGSSGLSDEVVFSINTLIEQLDNLQIQQIQSEAARKRLLSNFSHDIRTPLTSIIGYVDALKDDIGASQEEKRDYLEVILKKTANLKELVDEIFHLARLDADEIPLKMETLDLSEMTREVLIGFLPELKQSCIELKAAIPDKRCPVMADRLSIMRVIGNLVKNAIQYGKDGHVLGVELEEKDTEVYLHVWDRGTGIEQEDLVNIFERLYRTDRSRNSLGSGLGLAIAKTLAEKNNGRIWVESIPGEKTIFSFSVPKPG